MTKESPTDVLSALNMVGVNFRSAPPITRSSLSFQRDGMLRLIETLHSLGCGESLVLSTCNRTEIYFTGADFGLVLDSVATACEVRREVLGEVFYCFGGRDAVRQLFKVASGLDSAVLGEHEIVGQLKAAYQLAKEAQSISHPLDALVQRALRVSKRVRNQLDSQVV